MTNSVNYASIVSYNVGACSSQIPTHKFTSGGTISVSESWNYDSNPGSSLREWTQTQTTLPEVPPLYVLGGCTPPKEAKRYSLEDIMESIRQEQSDPKGSKVDKKKIDVAPVSGKEVQSYPPHNIFEELLESGERRWTLEFGVAGWEKAHLAVSASSKALDDKETQYQTTVFIRGEEPPAEKRKREEMLELKGSRFREIHRKIAKRNFALQFPVFCKAIVTETNLRNGILTIVVQEILPDAHKEGNIPIGD